MDNIKELHKYKELFDSGAITEAEFLKLKQKLLGLKTEEEKEIEKQVAREKALEEIEEMRKAQSENAQADVWAAQAEETKQEEPEFQGDAATQEKAVEQADEKNADETERINEKKQIKNTLQNNSNYGKVLTVISKVFFWILTVFLAILTLGCFMSASQAVGNFVAGVILLLLTLMACPLITKKTREIDKLLFYCRIKKIIVIGLVILFFIVIVLM